MEFKAVEFTDVKSNDFIELAGVEPAKQGFTVANHRAKWRLRQTLEASGVTHAYDQIHYTGDPIDGVITYSKSLIEIMTEAVVHDEPQKTQFGTGGSFYSVAHSASLEHKLDIPVDLINAVMMHVYGHIKETEKRG